MVVLLVFTLLVVVPAFIAFSANTSFLPRPLVTPVFGVGAPVVYEHLEISTQPRPEMRGVWPSERGEFYYCTSVDFLRVTHVLDDGRLIAIAPDNRRFCFWPDDSQFRKARLTERLRYRGRFPH